MSSYPMNNIIETIKPINPKFLMVKTENGQDRRIFLDKVQLFTDDVFGVIVAYDILYIEKISEQFDYIEKNVGSNFVKLIEHSEINDGRRVLVNKDKVISIENTVYGTTNIVFDSTSIINVNESFEKVSEIFEEFKRIIRTK